MASTIQQIETPKCARALDTSSNNNHGQIYSGRALEFDGVTDYLDLGATNTFVDFSAETTQANRAWTVVCWVKPYVITTETNSMNMIGSNVTQSINYVGLRGAGAHVNKLTIYDVGATTWRVSNTALNINTWYRAVWVFDGDTTVSFYLNGVADGTGEIDNTGAYADMALRYIGALNNNSRFWDGALADLQLWQGAWTASDVAYDYLNPESLVLSNGGTSLTESNLKAWYPMQDGNRSHQTNILDASNTGLGDELVTNGSFTTDSDWNKNSNWTIDTTGGAVAVADGSANTDINQVIASHPVANNTYKVTFDVVSVTAGSVHFLFGGATGTSRDSVGTYSEYITASNTDRLKIDSHASNLFAGSIDNVSVKLVNAKNNATTVFFGDEQITDSKNRDFASASDWVEYSPNGSAPTFGDDGSPAYLEITGLADTDPQGATLAVSNLTTPVVGRTYRIQADIWWDSSNPGIGSVFKIAYAGATSSAFEVTATVATSGRKTVDLVATSASGDLIIYYEHANQTKWFIDDVTVKEVGVATGWTDADQQLHIPQTALQSYNELLYFRGQEVDGTETDNVPITVGSNIWNATNDQWNSISAWVSFTDPTETNNGMIWAVDNLNPSLYYTYSGSNINIGYNTGNGEIFGVTVLATRLEDKFTHFVMNWKRNSNSDDTAIDGTDVEFFINGEKQTCSYVQGSNSNSCDTAADADLDIGDTESDTAAYSHIGVVTEISAWTYQLTSADVRELYNDGKALDALTHSKVAYLTGYWRNNGLAVWKDLVASNNGTPSSTCQETMIIPQGLDSRDSQGFIMNRQRNTSSLNLTQTYDGTVNVISDRPYVDVVDETPLTYVDTENKSYLFWIKRQSALSVTGIILGGGTVFHKLVSVTNNANSNATITIESDTNSDAARAANGDIHNVALGDWVHVGIVVTGTSGGSDNTVEMYINGQGVTEGDNTLGDGNNVTMRYIGTGDPGDVDSDRAFHGEIDGLLVYSDVLSAAEVLRNYNATKGSHRN